MSRLQILGVLCTAALIVLPPASHGNKTTFKAKNTGCVTAECHSGIGKAKFVHGPVAAGECVFCHERVGRHKFKPIPEDTAGLCYRCHDRKTEPDKALHPAIRDGRCTTCHDPHQSPYRYELRYALQKKKHEADCHTSAGSPWGSGSAALISLAGRSQGR